MNSPDAISTTVPLSADANLHDDNTGLRKQKDVLMEQVTAIMEQVNSTVTGHLDQIEEEEHFGTSWKEQLLGQLPPEQQVEALSLMHSWLPQIFPQAEGLPLTESSRFIVHHDFPVWSVNMQSVLESKKTITRMSLEHSECIASLKVLIEDMFARTPYSIKGNNNKYNDINMS